MQDYNKNNLTDFEAMIFFKKTLAQHNKDSKTFTKY